MKSHKKYIGILLTLIASGYPLICAAQAKGLVSEVYIKSQNWGFQQILDEAGLRGVILVLDPQSEKVFSNDFARAESGHLPASTFKIPNGIIGLETGVVEGEHTVFEWDGQKRFLPEWEQDLSFSEAFRLSCVPCFQEIARSIGAERMKEYLKKFRYGNMEPESPAIDRFWLEGDSKISAEQQIDFLYRFYFSELPISERTGSIMKRNMVLEESDGSILSGKTGWVRGGYNLGWFVGYLENGSKVYFIAVIVEPTAAFDMELFTVIRRQLAEKALHMISK